LLAAESQARLWKERARLPSQAGKRDPTHGGSSMSNDVNSVNDGVGGTGGTAGPFPGNVADSDEPSLAAVANTRRPFEKPTATPVSLAVDTGLDQDDGSQAAPPTAD